MTEGSSLTLGTDGLVDVLARATAAKDLESVTRPLLEALSTITGFDSTYLTTVDLDDEVQRILYSRNAGDLDVPEGLEVAWSDTLCRRALEGGVPATAAVDELWGDSDAARTLGITSYASAPITLDDGTIFGTLCGASDRRLELDDRTVQLLEVFARLIADAVAKDRELSRARSRAEWATERLQSRVRFLAAAEHKLKTPLAVILAWSRMLEDLPPDEHPKALTAIERGAKALQLHIEEMLDEAQAELLGSDLDLAPIDISALCREVVSDCASMFQERTLTTELPSAVHARGDARAVRVVLEHLLENATKYTPAGTEVVCRVERRPDQRVAITVEDDGPGLPHGVDLFKPFERGRTDEPGSGLGLYIVQSLVDAMDATVLATQRPGGGARFEVLLAAA